MRLVFLAVIALVLLALRALGQRPAGRTQRCLADDGFAALDQLGSAATTRGSSIAWALQFACFLFAPVVFLATVITMGTRQWGASEEKHREFVYTMFGVLGFALFSC